MIKKSELKIGDILVCNNGSYYIYLMTDIGKRFLGNDGYFLYSSFDNDLKLDGSMRDRWNGELDIHDVIRLPEKCKIVHSLLRHKLYPNIDFRFLFSKIFKNKNFINLKLVLC